MIALRYVDHRDDPARWAQELSVSVHACRLLLDADLIDLHNVLELPVRWFGYRADRHHGVSRRPPFGTGHTDFPRLREASFTGVVTAVLPRRMATARQRLRSTLRAIARVVDDIRSFPDDLALVVDRAGYERTRASGRTAFWLALSGGHALVADLSVLEGPLGQQLHRIALIHGGRSALGGTARPSGYDDGLTDLGRTFLDRCEGARVLVDLAEAGPKTFRDALEHQPEQPFVVSHAGAHAVREHFGNLDDGQIAAIADHGGVIGVTYDRRALTARGGAARADVLAHLEHLLSIGGEGVAGLGTTYDGLIVPPRDLPDVTHHPCLVQDMLDRGWSEDRIRNVLGRNALRVFEAIRPGRQG